MVFNSGSIWVLKWIKEHDDRWSFILPYVALSVTLSVALSLFWLLLIIVVHVLIEWLRLKARPPTRRLVECLAQTQLDWALLLAAVCMEVYLETAAGLAGAGQFARGAGRLLGRIPGWQNSIRAIILSSDDTLQLIRLKKAPTEVIESSPRIERLPLMIFSLVFILLLIAPYLLPIDYAQASALIREAFSPFH
jgi:hypothetical protein